MTSEQESTYRHCQSLVKGLDMLAALNRMPSGSGSISELAQQPGIHRSTVKRLLETLREQGYLAHDPATNHYRLTFRVQRLSYGFRDTVCLVRVTPFQSMASSSRHASRRRRSRRCCRCPSASLVWSCIV